MMVIGLDPGKDIGWCVCKDGLYSSSGVLTVKEIFPRSLFEAARKGRDIPDITNYVDNIVLGFELPQLRLSERDKNKKSIMKLMMLTGALVSSFETLNPVPIIPVWPTEHKGNEVKYGTMQRLISMGLSIKNDHEADAISVAMAVSHEMEFYAKHHAWSGRFREMR